MSGPDAPDRVLVLHCPSWTDPPVPPRPGSAGPAGSSREDDPSGEAARDFEAVVAVAGEFCPKVEVLRPGTCAFATRGPARYFGGEAELARRLVAAVRAAGVACQAGIADGLFAAGLAAGLGSAGPAEPGRGESGDGAGPVVVPAGGTRAFLAPQPVSVLGSDELAALLPRLGITTLGELAALPAAQAADRFGPAGELASRLARGLDPRPLIPRPPAEDLSVAVAFDPPAGQAEPVVFAAKSLADQLHARLAGRGMACVRVQVQVHDAGGRQLSRLWRHDGLLSGLAVAERVRWQLDGWQPEDPDRGVTDGPAISSPEGMELGGRCPGGIVLLRLVPDQLVRAAGHQLRLWGDAVVSDRVARAALRVQALLGHAAVTRPVLAGGRRPAGQVLLVPFGDSAVPRRPAGRPWPGQVPAPAPATVYPAPLPARVTDASGTAVSVTGRAAISAPPAWLAVAGRPAAAVTAWAGPWPVTEEWWDPERACRQARFQLLTADGGAWLAALQDGRWQVEASYD